MKFKEIKEKIEKYLKLKAKCPKCGGILDEEFFDLSYDCLVYKCRICGERFL